MALANFEMLYARADRAKPRLPVVVAGGADLTVVTALQAASQRGWVSPVLVGDPAQIESFVATAEVDPGIFRIVPVDGCDPDVDLKTSQLAVKEIHEGRAAALMKGQISTPALMKGVLQREGGLRTGEVIAQVVLMEVLRDRRTFLLSDTGITVAPTLEQKVGIAAHLAKAGRALALDPANSKVQIGVMAATEKVTEAMPDTLDIPKIQELVSSDERFAECEVNGPLSFDLAYASKAGERKKLSSGGIGATDAMLFSSLQAANLTVKAIMYTADCRFGGFLAGTTHPVVFMSRADDVETRLNSLALTLAMIGVGN